MKNYHLFSTFSILIILVIQVIWFSGCSMDDFGTDHEYSDSPPQPVILNQPSEINDGSMTLSWKKSEDTKFYLYLLYYATSEGFDTTSTERIRILDRNKTEVKVDGLIPVNMYFFKLFVVDRDGNKSSSSNEVNSETTLGSWQVVSRIPLPAEPNYMIFNQNQTAIYISSEYRGSRARLYKLSTISHSIIHTIDIGNNTYAGSMVLSPDGQDLFVRGGPGIVRIFTPTDMIIDQVELYNSYFFGYSPFMDISEKSNTLLIFADPFDGFSMNLFRFSLYDLQLEDSLSIDNSNNDIIAVSPDEEFAVAYGYYENEIQLISISLNSVLKTLKVGNDPSHVEFSPDGRLAYVLNSYSSYISVIDLRNHAVTNEIPSDGNRSGMCISPNGALLFLFPRRSGKISVISTATMKFEAEIEGIGYISQLIITSDGRTLYALSRSSYEIVVIQLVE
ncbi:MAG: fibronectin type III domain-containing protein [Candidatus Electryonea clarkiae]|nr:fibronectin type III domain-containing protein [Candidatus Electryonea clarkiae]MDP8287999.1 fibronectin type III domain-containing protein [Candidatus Electryonea clarkiae]